MTIFYFSFNPTFRGSRSGSLHLFFLVINDELCFNPTFRGSRSGSDAFKAYQERIDLFQSYFSWKSFWKKLLDEFRNTKKLSFNPTFRGSRSGSGLWWYLTDKVGLVSILLFVEVVLEAVLNSLKIAAVCVFQSYFSWKSFWKMRFEFNRNLGVAEFQSYFSWKSFWKNSTK